MFYFKRYRVEDRVFYYVAGEGEVSDFFRLFLSSCNRDFLFLGVK